MEQVMEFFTISKLLMIGALLYAATLFSKSIRPKRKKIWEGVMGEDGILQPIEIAIWYWVKFFPYLFFLSLLIIVLQYPMEQMYMDILNTLWLGLNSIYGVAIVGKSFGKNGKANGTNQHDQNGGGPQVPTSPD